MKHLRIVAPVAVMWFIVAEGAFCQSSDSLQSVQNIVYGEVAGLLILGNLSLNYEYILGDHFSLRAGIGAGYLIEIADDLHGSVGGLAMVNFFTAADHKLELGLGASCVFPSMVCSPIRISLRQYRSPTDVRPQIRGTSCASGSPTTSDSGFRYS